jgi:hypothetical protein
MRCVYGSAPSGTVEHLRLDGARNDVDGRRDAALAPVSPQPLAQHHEPVALVVDAREEPLVRAGQRHQDAGLEELVLREPLRQEDVVGRHQVRRVHAQKGDALHLAEPHPELEQEGGRLREDDVEVPAVGVEDPGGQRHRQVKARVGLQRDAWQRDCARSKLLGRGVGIMGADDCDFVTTPA